METASSRIPVVSNVSKAYENSLAVEPLENGASGFGQSSSQDGLVHSMNSPLPALNGEGRVQGLD